MCYTGSMTFHIAWENEDRICILLTFEGTLTWDVIREGLAELRIMMDSVPHRVHWITNASQSSGIPRENVMQNLRGLLNDISDNARMNVVVIQPSNIFTKAMLSSFIRVVGWPWGFAIAQSVEEAREIIEAKYPSGLV